MVLMHTVYGYGFLMILLVSSCSLLGVAVIPLLRKNSKFGQLYKFIYALMIAMGASALFCDAILHLIPEVRALMLHVKFILDQGFLYI